MDNILRLSEKFQPYQGSVSLSEWFMGINYMLRGRRNVISKGCWQFKRQLIGDFGRKYTLYASLSALQNVSRAKNVGCGAVCQLIF